MVQDLTKQTTIDRRTFKNELIQGDTYNEIVRVRDLSGELDLSSFVGRMYWLDNTWDNPQSRSILTTNDGIVGVPDNSDENLFRYLITISSVESQGLAINSFIYGDLKLENTNGTKLTVCRIQLKIRGGSDERS